jgi:hypothetical protein
LAPAGTCEKLKHILALLVLNRIVGEALDFLEGARVILLVDVVHDDCFMCADILREADALIDLPMALEELEDVFLASLAEGGSVLFKEFIESLLFVRDLLLKGAGFSWGGGCRKILLQRVDLIQLKLDDPGVEKHALRVKVLTLRVDGHEDPVQI